jgi:hypothetical protein
MTKMVKKKYLLKELSKDSKLKLKEGGYYVKLEQESIDDAINAHTPGGYPTIARAIEPLEKNGTKGTFYEVVSSELNVVFTGITGESEEEINRKRKSKKPITSKKPNTFIEWLNK